MLHDELSLPLGTMRLGRNLSAAGHNGVQSIIETLGTQDFIRLRLGVEMRPNHKIPSEDFVLQRLNDADQVTLEKMFERAADALTSLLTDGLDKAMGEYNRENLDSSMPK